jgi:predicted nucleic acid-binding protein
LILPDVNVLIYAFRTDSGDHQRYKEWLESVVNGPAAYGIAPQVLASVVSITTHTRIYRQPSSRADVFEFCRLLLEQPNATVTAPGPDTGQSSKICARKQRPAELLRRMPGSRHWPSNPAVNGLRQTGTTRVSRGSLGESRSELPALTRLNAMGSTWDRRALRMASTFLGGSVVVRGLMPQDLKLEIDQLSRDEAVEAGPRIWSTAGRTRSPDFNRRVRCRVRFRKTRPSSAAP